jgi:hypothetical protein
MSDNRSLQRCQQLLLGHGALVLLVGFALGFGFLFFLIGEVSLWPIPGVLSVQLPGTYDAWRMAHMEGITNGVVLWVLALVLPLLPGTDRFRTRITWGMIVAAWTIVIASALDPIFPEARGLKFGGNAANQSAFFLFFIGIVTVTGIVTAIAISCLRNARALGKRAR